jgi:hypothetical protein
MRTRPFLSHQRRDRTAVVALKRELALRGVGGWRDLDDLHLGELAQPGFEKAINEVCGGFIWHGTRRALRSDYINRVELPAAIARKRREPSWPLVPVFVSVSPGEVQAALVEAASKDGAKLTTDDIALFLDCNGYLRTRGEETAEMRAGVADRYLRSAVEWLETGRYSIAITALAEPRGTQDLTFDWRDLIDERTRVLASDSETVMRTALVSSRDAVRSTADFPHLVLDLDLPLPMAALVGYEWRVTSRLKLTIRQRTRSGIVEMDGDGDVSTSLPRWHETRFGGSGPIVLAVSTTTVSISEPASHYASEVGARAIRHLHVPGEHAAATIRGLARSVAGELRRLNGSTSEKHLLLAGPTALATLVGAGSNANLPVEVPLWDGKRYTDRVVLC